MKKLIVALAAIAMTAGFSAQAQDEQQCPQMMPSCPPAQCEQAPRDCMFEDLNLTEAQKAQLQALGKKCMDAKKDKKQAKKEACKEDARNFLAEVKTILTPEQYVQFLENSFINKGNFGKGNRGPRMSRPRGHGPRGPQAPLQAPELD